MKKDMKIVYTNTTGKRYKGVQPNDRRKYSKKGAKNGRKRKK